MNGYNLFVDDLHASQSNNQTLASANNPCCYNKEMKWTVALLKLVDDLKAHDEAFGKILLWACNAAKDEYSFEPHDGFSRSNNKIIYLIAWKMPNTSFHQNQPYQQLSWPMALPLMLSVLICPSTAVFTTESINHDSRKCTY